MTIVTMIYFITYTIMNKYYSGELYNIHMQSLIDNIQENKLVITTKNG